MKPNLIIRDLGEGLVLRRASREDTNALVNMQIHAFGNPDTLEPDYPLGAWTRELMGPGTAASPGHPTFLPSDFFIVEDTTTGAIASTLCLISQTWTFGGIPVGVGRVELVATAAEYRGRGLVRAQFQAVHELSAARGELMQAITGIPYFYRQFGYEYAMHLVKPRATFVPQQIPELKKGEREPYRLRPAARRDLPFVARLLKQSAEPYLMSCRRDRVQLEYEQFGNNGKGNLWACTWSLIEPRGGAPVGLVFHRRYVVGGRIVILEYDLVPGMAFSEVNPSVLRGLAALGKQLPPLEHKPFSQLRWYLPDDHALYRLAEDRVTPVDGDYGWLIRVPDLPAFIRHVAPVLEARLRASPLRGYSGVLRLNFFKSGLEIKFSRGKVSAKAWQPSASDFGQSGFGNASFPDLTFLKLLFGYRTLDEVHAMFPDCTSDSEFTVGLLRILFPRHESDIDPIR